MKKIYITLMAAVLITAGAQAQETSDTVAFESFDDVVKRETATKSQQENDAEHLTLWDKRSYLDISYTSNTLESSEFPSANGMYDASYKSKAGINLQYGHTYDFHKKPIANMLFIGINYTGIDLNYAKYDAASKPQGFYQGDDAPYSVGWYNKKQTVDYGMALGPAVTVYPFAPLGCLATDKIRFQMYFQIGYNARLTIIDDVLGNPSKDATKTMYTFAHGMTTKFGFSLTWDFVGLGYEIWNASKLTNITFSEDYDTGNFKSKARSSRLFLQFRF